MADSVKDWYENNCRPTGKNKLVCETEQGVEVIDPVDPDLANQPATPDNIENFVEQNKAMEFDGGEQI